MASTEEKKEEEEEEEEKGGLRRKDNVCGAVFLLGSSTNDGDTLFDFKPQW